MKKKHILPEGEFLYHTSCNVCGSSDANSVYSSDTSYCYSCKTFKKLKGGVVSEQLSKGFNDTTWEEANTSPFSQVVRGITPKVLSQYSYYKADDGSHVINHYDNEGRIVAQKYRYKDKTFKWKGNSKSAVPFGMGQWRSGGKRITITEGELDCLSVAEALDGKYPVISINGGAGGIFVTQSLGTSNTVQFSSLGIGTAGSGTTGEIRATNNITAYYSSDRKFKENIEDIPNALEIVDTIGGKLFDWTDSYIQEHGGADGYFVQKRGVSPSKHTPNRKTGLLIS